MTTSKSATVFLLLAAVNAYAEGGEAVIETSISGEIGFYDYKRDAQTKAVDITAGGAIRAGATFAYGVTDWLDFGLGVTGSLASNLEQRNVKIEQNTGRLYLGYWDVSVPVFVQYNLTWGHDFYGKFRLKAGPAFMYWTEKGLVDDTVTDNEGKYPEIPIDKKEGMVVGGMAGASAEVVWRPVDWFALAIGPYVEARHTGLSGAYSVGVSLSPEFLFGLGPSW